MTGSTYELAELKSREALAATLIFAVKLPCSEHDPSLSTAYWRGYYSNDTVPSYSSKASLPSPEAMRQTSGISDGDLIAELGICCEFCCVYRSLPSRGV